MTSLTEIPGASSTQPVQTCYDWDTSSTLGARTHRDLAGTGPMDDSRRCTATNAAGARCAKAAILGGSVCRSHGGAAPQVKAQAARRLAEAGAARSLKLADVEVTPIEDPLSKLADVAAMAVAWMDHIAPKLDELHSWSATTEGGTEQVRALVALFERSMDRSQRFLADWVRLGFDERMVAMNERQASLVAEVLRAVLDDPELGLDEDTRQVGRTVAARHLRAVA